MFESCRGHRTLRPAQTTRPQRAPDTSLTGSPTVAAALASTIADAGTALRDTNRSGCPAKP